MAHILEGTIGFAGRYRLKCMVQNLSETGAKLAFHTVTDAPAEFTLNVSLAGQGGPLPSTHEMA